MRSCPTHIEAFVSDANSRFPEVHDRFHHYFKLKCRCGHELFRLFESNKQSVKAFCGRCGQEILLYDLSLYPCASKTKGAEDFVPIPQSEGAPFEVFVGYEYGELDQGEEFDQNDITWCQVFIERGGQMVKVFDDETA